MTPPRGRRAQAESIRRQLGPRDWDVLEDLARVRLLTGRQVQRLHVHEGSGLTQARRSRALLQRLYDLRLVHRMERRVGGIRAGSAGYTYALASLGQHLTTGHGPAGGKRRRKPWDPSHWFVDHVLAVSELYVRLREAERDGEPKIVLDAFDAEPAAWRWWTGPAGERLVLKPDAFVAVLTEEFEHRWLVERDLGTESLPVIRRKAEAYVAYWRSGFEQSREGLFPKVLFIADTNARVVSMLDVLTRLDAEAWQLFQVTDAAQAAPIIAGRSPPSR